MRGVMLEVPSHLLDERARTDAGRFDEMWEGELHMVPPPSYEHQRMERELHEALRVPAADADLEVLFEVGLFDPSVAGPSSYRQPDLAYFPPSARSERGIEGAAALVIEIASPGDESLDKLPFYDRVGVAEVVIIDRDTKTLRHRLRDQGGALLEVGVGDGVVLGALAVTLRTADGRLLVDTGDGRTTI